MSFSHKFIPRITDISSTEWNKLFDDNPFTRYEFLHACEVSECANSKTGWQPQHLLILKNNKLIAIVPGYLKSHSYGEYVFDWSWAEAYEKHNIAYYPKWIAAIPFTPVEGIRIATKLTNTADLYSYITDTLDKKAIEASWSGWHINFCKQNHSTQLSNTMPRLGVQFQWFNNNYQTFNDFLQHLNSRKRKNIKRERFKALSGGINVEWLTAAQITDEIISLFIEFYQATYLKRSGHLGYLNKKFFALLLKNMPDNLLIMIAKKQDQVIAATLSLKSTNTLYGRYWGASEACDFLHFELCYYQGIEYCIKHKLACFHSGAQGEHKIARGFQPVFTYSNHKIMHSEFSHAIDHFLKTESQHMIHYHQQAKELSPFKQSS